MSDVTALDPYDKNLLPLMSDYRLKKLQKMQNENARRLSVGAELLLCYALKKNYGSFSLPLDIKVSPKPYIDGVNFSLSHSKEYAACAISPNSVGLDIEKITPSQNLDVGKKFLTSDELKLLNHDSFFDFWTKKESYLKLHGITSFPEVTKFNVSDSGTHFESFTENGYKITAASEMPDTAALNTPDMEEVIRFLLQNQ